MIAEERGAWAVVVAIFAGVVTAGFLSAGLLRAMPILVAVQIAAVTFVIWSVAAVVSFRHQLFKFAVLGLLPLVVPMGIGAVYAFLYAFFGFMCVIVCY